MIMAPGVIKYDKALISKEKLINVINKEPEKITYVAASKDDRYKSFKRIKLESKATDFVVCEECPDRPLIKYNTLFGNGSVRDHLEGHQSKNNKKKPKQTTIDMFTAQKVTATEKAEIADKVAIMCATDFRPFCIAEGKGFISLIQSIIKIVNIKRLRSSDPNGAQIRRRRRRRHRKITPTPAPIPKPTPK